MTTYREKLLNQTKWQYENFFRKHHYYKGINPRLESIARGRAGIKNSYYYCWDCAERIKKNVEVEKF